MKKSKIYLWALMFFAFTVISCDDDFKEPEHNCYLPEYKEFVGEMEIGGIEYEFYRFTPSDDRQPVGQVMTPYAFVTDVEPAEFDVNVEIPYSVKFSSEGEEEDYIVGYISSDAFDDFEKVKTITLPASVSEIYGNEPLFEDCVSLTDIYCPSFADGGQRLPIEVESNGLGCNYDKVKLHVNKNDIELWKTARGWCKFKNIVGDL